MAPTNAQIVLAAVQAAIDGNAAYIHLLAQRHKLKAELVLRILLTFLPESTEPTVYIPLLRDLNGDANELPDSLAEVAEEKNGQEWKSPEEAKKRVKDIRLLPLSVPDRILSTETDSLSPSVTTFLLARARRIDSETGHLPFVQQLLEPFVEQSSYLKLWLGSTILPLLRINYELFPNREEPILLVDFEELRGGAALDTLIGGGVGGSVNVDDYIRDLKQVVSPWLCGEIYRRRHRMRRGSTVDTGGHEPEENTPLMCWSWVNNWLMHIASKSPSNALAIARSSDWHGPGDVDDGGWIGDDPNIMSWIWNNARKANSEFFKSVNEAYLKTCLSLCYIVTDTSEETLASLEDLLLKISDALGEGRYVRTILYEFPRDEAGSSVLPGDFLLAVQAKVHRLQPVELLEDTHPLTSLNTASVALAAHLITTAQTLLELKQPLSLSRILHISMLGTANEQRVLLQRTVQNFEDKKSSDDDCEAMRTRILDVTSNPQSSDQAQPYGIFGKIWVEDPDELDVLILKSEISSARYRHVIETYLNATHERLSEETIEDVVVQVASTAYDNATNGNRTRGGVKKASEIVAAFKQSFPISRRLSELEALIRGTHALSFYKLTLQHGVPCAPVNIRVHQQPLSLIDKVLVQNPQSYAQLDNLISIGVDLVRAGLIKSTSNNSHHEADTLPDQELLAAHVSREITAKAISAALEEGDFDTAYSYITTRLSSQVSANADDDILWRAAYAAGKASPPNGTSSQQLRRLEQKMELLSQALSLAPPSALTDVLSTWQECEARVNEALAAETEAEERWNEQGDSRAVSDRHLPGGFGSEAFIPNAEGSGGRQVQAGRRKQEEAPMGLFDVARAAGSALQKSAFPLGGAGRGQGPRVGAAPAGEDDEHADGQRVRKRDVVSNAVTSGLVSGIGWVIGRRQASEIARAYRLDLSQRASVDREARLKPVIPSRKGRRR